MGAAEKIEDDIRTRLKTKRIRVTEFFIDFDRLRSGYITSSQFKRCLDQFLGLKLTDQQVDELVDKYCLKKDGMVNYRAFSDVIEKNFVANKLNVNPEAQAVPSLEYLGTERSQKTFDPELNEKVQSILNKIQNYYTYHGVNIRTCYEDFDRHHNGLVSESQFARRFPGPPDVTESDVQLLVLYYQDPVKPSLTNYLNFHQDIEKLKRIAAVDKIVLAQHVPDEVAVYHYNDKIDSDPDLKMIFDKIRVAVYKNGIRVKEFFKDHDKLRSGIITKNQFVCGLSIGCSKEAHLTMQEIERLADYYKTTDGRVYYKEFCDIMQNAFNVPHLEKRPTVHPIAPASGSLTRTLGNLNAEQNDRVIETLSYLSEIVRKRQLFLYPYFKDFDRSMGYTRNVTKPQFARVLHFLSLNISEEDLKLLCLKFKEPTGDDINYPAFCQAVDTEFNHYTVDAPLPVPSSKFVPKPLQSQIDTSHVQMNEIMSRIRNFVLINRIRVGEFFEDYDPLRSGSISKPIFCRGLDLMGVTWLSKVDSFALQQCYLDPKKPDCVVWTDFMSDVESVFTEQNLEKTPTKQIPPLETFVLPIEGAHVEWMFASPKTKDLYDACISRMQSRATQRRLLAKPVFQDFDLHNRGHVTLSQFRQCLATLDLPADEEETTAIEMKFKDKIGFNYVQFLNELMPQDEAVPKYKEHLKELQAVNACKKPPEIDALTDLNAILTKIKVKVSKERMRLYEFLKDYDKLRTGRIKRSNFARALDLAGLLLKESEVDLLANAFQSPACPGFVEYLAFSNEVETIFTLKHLEKSPLITPIQYKPLEEWQQNTLSAEEEIVYKQTMHRVGEHVRKTRTQLFPLFEDYDRVHIGSVSRSQFHRVLSELEMGSLLNEQEFRVIFTKFNVRIGGKNDVNYIAFCDSVYEIAKFDPLKP